MCGNRIMQYYLISTDHLSDRIWFKDDDDFKLGMNHVAVMAAHNPVDVLGFVLMSNHVHFVVSCSSSQEAKYFTNRFKQLYARYYYNKYGINELLRRNNVDIRTIPVENEALEKSLAYTVMNPVAANICSHPSEYIWGSGACYYRTEPVEGKRMGAFSIREKMRILRTKSMVPDDYVLCSSGYIRPESYIDVLFVRNVFRTPGRYSFFLRNSSKARARIESGKNIVPSFRDQVLVAAIPDICQTLFQKWDVESLDDASSARLAFELHRRFNADPKQIARLIGSSSLQVANWLECY